MPRKPWEGTKGAKLGMVEPPEGVLLLAAGREDLGAAGERAGAAESEVG